MLATPGIGGEALTSLRGSCREVSLPVWAHNGEVGNISPAGSGGEVASSVRVHKNEENKSPEGSGGEEVASSVCKSVLAKESSVTREVPASVDSLTSGSRTPGTLPESTVANLLGL